MKKTFLPLVCFIALVSLACQLMLGNNPALATPSAVNLDELQFRDPETKERFQTLNRCINNIVDDSWVAVPYDKGGNFITADWCKEIGDSPDCEMVDSIFEIRGQHIFELETHFYDSNFPEVFGIGFLAAQTPPATGWGATFSFDQDSDNIISDSWGISFSEYKTPDGPAESIVSLGWGYAYKAQETRMEIDPDLPLLEDLASYLESPEKMRDRGLELLTAMEEKVAATIQSHQVSTCDYGPYLGGGIPPECTLRPLSADEEKEEFNLANAYFANQKQLLIDHYQEMYAAWMSAFPMNECWK